MNPGKGGLPPMVFSSRDDWTTSRRSLQQRGARTPATRNGWACAAAARRERKRRYGATIKDAMTALWEAWDWACGKRLKAMIPTLLPASNMADCSLARRTVIVFWPSTATVDRLLIEVKIAASGGRRRRARRVHFFSLR